MLCMIHPALATNHITYPVVFLSYMTKIFPRIDITTRIHVRFETNHHILILVGTVPDTVPERGGSYTYRNRNLRVIFERGTTGHAFTLVIK